MRIAVIGLGSVGARAARQLVSTDSVSGVVLFDAAEGRANEVRASLGSKASVGTGDPTAVEDVSVAVIASPSGTHPRLARAFVQRGIHVVSTSDSIEDVRELLDLMPVAEIRGVSVAVGAGFAPGMSCMLARLAADALDVVDEIHVSRLGTGGPSCARQHHKALAGTALDWRDGGWRHRPGGSGRELNWFPDPIGGADCYRAALPDALLLVPAFPGVGRVTARLAATRRDRLTARLPMIRRPHPEGGLGAIRIEVRGRDRSGITVQILGAMDRPGIASGAVASVAAVTLGDGEAHAGAGGLAQLMEPKPFLAELARRGVKAARFG